MTVSSTFCQRHTFVLIALNWIDSGDARDEHLPGSSRGAMQIPDLPFSLASDEDKDGSKVHIMREFDIHDTASTTYVLETTCEKAAKTFKNCAICESSIQLSQVIN